MKILNWRNKSIKQEKEGGEGKKVSNHGK